MSVKEKNKRNVEIFHKPSELIFNVWVNKELGGCDKQDTRLRMCQMHSLIFHAQ
jgi:hypothetical protein